MESETRPKLTGAVMSVLQTVTLTRTADVDEVTGVVTYSAWSTGEWPSYVVPSVPGYTLSRAAVASAMVDAATLDQTVTITYAREQATKGDQLAQPPVVKSAPASGKPQEAAGLNLAGHCPAGPLTANRGPNQSSWRTRLEPLGPADPAGHEAETAG